MVIRSKSDCPFSTAHVRSKLRGTFVRIRSIHVGLVGFL